LIAESGVRGPEPDASEPGRGEPGSRASVPEPSTVERPVSDDERVNELALAYRSGRSEVLSELFAAVRPLLMQAIGRYGALLFGVVDRDLGREEFPPRHPQAGEQFAQRECLENAAHR
jgi:hypothetical protein